jgi:hypothetical protein
MLQPTGTADARLMRFAFRAIDLPRYAILPDTRLIPLQGAL